MFGLWFILFDWLLIESAACRSFCLLGFRHVYKRSALPGLSFSLLREVKD